MFTHRSLIEFVFVACVLAYIRTRLLIIFKCQSGPKNQRIYFDQKCVYILYIQATPLKNKETLMGIRRISRFVFIKERRKRTRVEKKDFLFFCNIHLRANYYTIQCTKRVPLLRLCTKHPYYRK